MKDGKYQILCVDDDPDILDTLQIFIEKAGYVYVGAASAEEGLRAYKKAKPDLVMVDLMMEETDSGANMVKELKVLGYKGPIYMLSNVGDALHGSIDSATLGLDGVFQKPIAYEVLVKTLKHKLK